MGLSAIVVAAGAALVACGGGSGSTVALVAYSTPREAYAELIPAFQKTDAGTDVTFDESYGSSGEQSRGVEAGLPADVVGFSLEPDMTRLVDAGLVAADWSQNEYDGFVTKSVVVLVVRKGNPKGITGWADLTKPGVEVIEPNPFTSGGAKWNIMAAYGAQLKQGKSEDEAKAYLKDLFDHVPVQDKSAREALQTFVGGKGDVLLSYENEAIAAQQAGEDVEYIVPAETILIENPLAVTEEAASSAGPRRSTTSSTRPRPRRSSSPRATARSSRASRARTSSPRRPSLFTIADLGGWAQVNDAFFAPDGSVMATIEQGLGISTSK